jgi:replicative DNA helicase
MLESHIAIIRERARRRELVRMCELTQQLRPSKYWLKESGALEADVHVILLVFRPRDEHDQPNGKDELIIAKQRNGPNRN